jgi:intein/homing endonuclease
MKYNNAKIVLELNNVGIAIANTLQEQGARVEGFKTVGTISKDFEKKGSKQKAIEKLAVDIEHRNLTISDWEVAIDELGVFGCELSPSGNIKYGAPEGYHDDCLKEGTLIKTINGYIPIEDIKIGDLVLTHKNRYRKVVNSIKKQFDGDWYDFKFQCQIPLGLSYNHPLYSALSSYYKNEENGNYKKRNWIFPKDWKKTYRQISIIESLSDSKNVILKESDFYKNGKYARSNVLKEIKLDNSFSKFLGLFLAEGHCGRMSDKDYRCSVAFNKNHTELIKEIKDYLSGLGISIQEREYGNTSNAFSLQFSSKFLHAVLSECYDKNREKKLPYYSRFLGKNLNYVLEYWLKGDGWKTRGMLAGATTSKSLALSMRDLAFSCGKYSTIQKIKRHRYKVPTKDQFWLYISDNWKKQSHLRKLSKFEYGSRISGKGIKKSNFKGNVYNLQIEEDKSFIADGIVVHNCVMALALANWGLYSKTKANTIRAKRSIPPIRRKYQYI